LLVFKVNEEPATAAVDFIECLAVSEAVILPTRAMSFVGKLTFLWCVADI
jgi:hypothetical protein